MRPKELLTLHKVFGTARILPGKKARNKLLYRFRKPRKEQDGVVYSKHIKT